MAVGEGRKRRLQAVLVVGAGAAGIAHAAHLGQQAVVQGTALARQRYAALLDLAKTGGVRALVIATGEQHALLQRLEAGLAQQDGAGAAGWAFDHILGIHAMGGHAQLGGIDVEGARCQVVDVRPLEADYIGDQAVGLVQLVIGGGIHGGLAVPAEGLQRFAHKFIGLRVAQATGGFALGNQRQRAVAKDLAAGQDGSGFFAHRRIGNQLQAQQRGEHPERVAVERAAQDRAERGGVHRHASHRQVVVAHGLHAHHGKQAAQGGQLFFGAHADGAMALHIQALQLIGLLHRTLQRGLGLQHLAIDLGHQRHQAAVLRHFVAVHIGHGAGEARTDFIGVHKVGHRGYQIKS